MKLIDYYSHKDTGNDYFLNILQYKRFCLFQFMIQNAEYGGSSGAILSIGHSSIFGISTFVWKTGFSFDFCTWKCRDLDIWRHGLRYYLENYDDAGDVPI